MSWNIKNEHGHYAIYKDGIFYCTADTRSEANDVVYEGSKGCSNCLHDFHGSMCANCSRNIHNHFTGGVDNWAFYLSAGTFTGENQPTLSTK